MEKIENGAKSAFPMTEAREHPRLRLTPMAYVELAQNNGGILLNLSEGGLAVQSALMLSETQLNEIRFQLPGERDWVKTDARVAWMSESRKEAGIEFLNFAEESRLKVRQWMAAESLRGADARSVEARTTVANASYQRKQAINYAPLSIEHGVSKPANRPDVVRGTLFPSAGASDSSKRRDAPPATPAVEQNHSWAENWAFQLDKHSESDWSQTGQRHGSRRGWMLLSVAVAILFFVLGATVGRGSVDFAVNYITAWRLKMTKSPQAPQQAAAPAQTEAPAASDMENGGQASANTNTSEGAPNPDSSSQASSAPLSSAPTNAQPATPDNGAASGPPAGSTAADATRKTPNASDRRNNPSESGAARAPSGAAGISSKPRPVPDNPSDSYAAQDLKDLGRTMIVTAPAPGNPSYRVSLPDEAVSASPTVAISSRRSFRVPPLTASHSTRSERVLIGKLVSHGEPFYPAEARRKRIDGTVEIRAIIGPRGEITNMDIVNGPPELVSAALTAIREWRYEPTFIDGDPIQMEDEITMVFRLP